MKFAQAIRLAGCISVMSLSAMAQPGDNVFQQCFANLQGQKYAEAVDECTRALAKSPDNAGGYKARGYAYVGTRQPYFAIPDLSRSLELAPDDLEVLALRGETYQQIGSFGKAIADFTRILQLEPKNLRALLRRAESLVGTWRNDLAIADLKTILTYQPNEPTAAKGIAGLQAVQPPFAYKGRELKSPADFLTEVGVIDGQYTASVTNVSPGPKPVIYFNLLSACMDRFRTSYECAEKIADEYSPFVSDEVSRSPAGKWLGDNELNIYNVLLQRPQKDAHRYIHRGQLLTMQLNHERAVEDFTKAIYIKPDDPSFYERRSAAYRDLKKYDLAIADINQAFRLDPRSPSAQSREYERLRLYNLAENPRYVTGFALLLLAKNPADDLALFERGKAYRAMGKNELAIADLSAVIGRNYNNEPALRERAAAYRALGNAEKAAQDEKSADDVRARILKGQVK